MPACSPPKKPRRAARRSPTEADFYGSMDGASKFVKGDAIAGVLILVVNIIGGLVLGTLSHGLSLGERRVQLCPARDRRRAGRAGPGPAALDRRRLDRHPRLLAASTCRARSPASSASASAWTAGRRHPRSSSACCRACRTSSSCPPPALAGFIAWQAAQGREGARVAAATPAEAPVISPSADRLGRGLGRRRARPRARLRAGRPGRRAQGRAADGADHRHPPPAVARARLRRAAGAGARRSHARRPNAYRITVAGVVVAEDEIWPEDLLALDSAAT